MSTRTFERIAPIPRAPSRGGVDVFETLPLVLERRAIGPGVGLPGALFAIFRGFGLVVAYGVAVANEEGVWEVLGARLVSARCGDVCGRVGDAGDVCSAVEVSIDPGPDFELGAAEVGAPESLAAGRECSEEGV